MNMHKPRIRIFFALMAFFGFLLWMTATGWAAMNTGAPVTANFQNTDIREAMQTLAAAAQANITVSANVNAQVTAQFSNTPFRDAFKSLLSQAGLTFKRVGEVIYVFVPGQPPDGATPAPNNSAPGSTVAGGLPRVIKIKYVKADQMKTSLGGVVPEDRMRVEPVHNALIINASEDEYKKIDSVLAQLDVPPKQVMFEAEVVELAKSTVSQFGVNWQWSSYPSPPGSSYVGVIKDVDAKHNYNMTYQATLNALVTGEKAKILANPRVAALDGQTARILIGDRLPVETKYIYNGIEQVSITYIDVGIKLEVTPWVNEDGVITTKLKPEVSTNIATSGNNPSVRTREAETTLRVRNGETIVIGGLIQNESHKNYNKIPLLGDLPIVGRLFKSSSKEKMETELVIFITPKIIDNSLRGN